MSTTDPIGTRATVRPNTGEQPPYIEDPATGRGWVAFAGAMLAILATLNVIYGIAAVSNSTVLVNDARFVVSGLNTWGWILLAVGVTQGLTALGVWARMSGARWVGVLIAALNAISLLLIVQAYPFWSLSLFALDILVIYGLIAHGKRAAA
jgi:hypothetical protein